MAWQDTRTDSQLQSAASTDQSARAELRTRGYAVGAENGSIYVEKAGSPSAPSSPSNPTNPNDLNALRSFFSETAGFSREELAEKKRQFDVSQAFAEKQMQEIGLPELAIKQKLADLEHEKFQADLGLQYLSKSAELGGPANYFQQVAFQRGAQQQNVVPFLDAIQRNVQLPAFQGVGNTPPAPQTMASLASGLTNGQIGGAPAGTDYNPDALLARIGSIFQAGPTSVAPGTLERLDQNELDLLRSGGKQLGYDPEAFLRAYSKGGIQQKSGVAA